MSVFLCRGGGSEKGEHIPRTLRAPTCYNGTGTPTQVASHANGSRLTILFFFFAAKDERAKEGEREDKIRKPQREVGGRKRQEGCGEHCAWHKLSTPLHLKTHTHTLSRSLSRPRSRARGALSLSHTNPRGPCPPLFTCAEARRSKRQRLTALPEHLPDLAKMIRKGLLLCRQPLPKSTCLSPSAPAHLM